MREGRMQGNGLGLVGAPNARDLGGLPAAGGRRVRSRALLRASALGRLADQDVELLRELRVRRVIDLRHGSEIEVAPPDRLPGDPPPRVHHIPVFDPVHPVFTYVSAVLLGHDSAGYDALRDEGTTGAMVAIYRWFVTDETPRRGFAQALRLIADARGEPVLYHCSAGKDRTGWLSALLLELLGVDRGIIVADYLATNEYARATNLAVMDAMRARGRRVDPGVLMPVLEARLEYLEAAYEEAVRGYGSVEGYVRKGLGLETGDIDALRSHLLH
jgi:protein-tyrosine phosphatase